MTDRSTLIAGKKQSDRLREKLSTPEGRMQDSLEHTLPQSVVADAQKREMWDVHPDVAASAAAFDAVLLLVQARYLAIRDSAGAKSFGRWFQSSKAEAQELDAWCRKLVGKAAKSFNFADKFRAEAQSGIESEAEELYLRFVRSSRQCAFPISSVNGEDSPAFSRAMRAVISTLSESTPELWDLAIEKATPKPLTPEEREYIRRSPRGDSIMQERAHTAGAVICFCRSVSGGDSPCTRAEEENALIALSHAFHCSRCTGRSLSAELQPGFRLFKRLLALRKELIRIASAAADWEWIANQNPDVPADELTKIVTEAYREGRWPRGKLNVDYDTWHDLLNGGQMALYPDVRSDALYILSAQNNSLGLWRVL